MAKYTDAQLKEMAITVNAARNSGDTRYMFFLIRLMQTVGLEQHDCENRINHFANMEL